MKVKATRMGQFQGRFIERGEVFDVPEELFSDSNTQHGWMEKVVLVEKYASKAPARSRLLNFLKEKLK